MRGCTDIAEEFIPELRIHRARKDILCWPRVQGLEIDEVSDIRAESVGDSAQQVDSDVYLTGFDLPQMRLVRIHHERKSTLRKTLLFAKLPYGFAQYDSAPIAFHGFRVCATLPLMTCYSKSSKEVCNMIAN